MDFWRLTAGRQGFFPKVRACGMNRCQIERAAPKIVERRVDEQGLIQDFVIPDFGE
jgi:hypothetical protein